MLLTYYCANRNWRNYLSYVSYFVVIKKVKLSKFMCVVVLVAQILHQIKINFWPVNFCSLRCKNVDSKFGVLN